MSPAARRRAGLCALLLAVLALMPSGRGDQLGAGWWKGVNVTSYTDADVGGGAGRAALDAAQVEAGADTASVVSLWYAKDRTASAVAPEAGRSPSDEALGRALEAAKARGMRTVLKPHVDLLDGAFRGALAPADRPAFWRSYGAYLGRMADLAARTDADVLVVGTELTALQADEQQWRALVADVRQRFDGTLSYAANWVQGAEGVPFWDALDLVGIDAYMPLTATPSADAGALAEAWVPWIARIERLHERTGKDVWLSELGYQPRADAAVRPYDARGAFSLATQTALYEAAFRAWRRTPWLRGISWWDWPADRSLPARTEAGSFSARGRPVREVLGAWHGARG